MTKEQQDLNDALKLLGYALGFISSLKCSDDESLNAKCDQAYNHLSDGVDKLMIPS